MIQDKRNSYKFFSLLVVALLLATVVGAAAFPGEASASANTPVTVEKASSQTATFAVANQTKCGGFWRSLPLNLGSIRIADIHVDVGMCWNGKKAWLSWGPNCYISGITLLIRYETTWCGVWNNNNFQTQPGMNFKLTTFIPKWGGTDVYVRYGWMRFSVYGDGAALWATGGLS